MPVLLNGGVLTALIRPNCMRVPLVDACVTEWRRHPLHPRRTLRNLVPLVDACVTEWRVNAVAVLGLCVVSATR